MRDKQFNAIGCAYLLLAIIFIIGTIRIFWRWNPLALRADIDRLQARVTALETPRKASGQAEPVQQAVYPVTLYINGEQWQRVYRGLPGMAGQAKSLRSVGDLREARR